MKRNTNNNDNTGQTINYNHDSINNGNKSETTDRIFKNPRYSNEEEAITKTILNSVPKESQITLARFEGPNIALYTKNPKFSLTELTYYLSSLSKTLKKRFIVRTDNSIRLQEDKTRSIVAKILPKDIIVSAVF
jgi:predicted metal-dependent RNase